MAPRGWQRLVLVGLALLGFASAIADVQLAFESRRLVARLSELQQARDALMVTKSRLLLEQHTWSAPARVEQLAKRRLEMREPSLAPLALVEADHD